MRKIYFEKLKPYRKAYSLLEKKHLKEQSRIRAKKAVLGKASKEEEDFMIDPPPKIGFLFGISHTNDIRQE